ncbi:MAG: two-component regulator propeller domain-containing protein [Bacteroidales bacterium]
MCRKKGRGYVIQKLLLLFILLNILPDFLFAQNKYYQLQFSAITIEDGLINNKVNCISKDKHGFIWFATNDGLCRYGGLKLWDYHLDPLKTKNVNTNHINTLGTDSEGNLWVGAFSLFRYDDESDSFRHYSSQDSLAQRIGRVRAIICENNEKLYLGSGKGFFSYYPGKDSLVNHVCPGITKKNIYALMQAGDAIWIGTEEDGIMVFSKKTERFNPLKIDSGFKGGANTIHCFTKENEHIIWAGTYTNGVLRINTKKQTIENIYPDPHNELSYRVRSIDKDSNGNIWFGTRNGLYLKLVASDSIIHYAHIKHPVSRITENSIFDVFIDNHNVIWIGTLAGGANYTNLNSKPIYNYSKYENLPGSLSDNILSGFCEDHLGNLYIGTNNGGLNYFNKKSGTFISYERNQKDKCSIGSNNVKSIVRDRKNNLWVGMYGGGVNYFNTTTKCFLKLDQLVKPGNDIIRNYVYSLVLDKNQDLWIGSERGLDRLNTKEKTIDNIIKNSRIFSLYKDHYDRIWASEENSGIYLYNEKTDKFEQKFSQIISTGMTAIHLDSKDNLWLGGNIGLLYINTTDSTSKLFTKKDGLPTNLVMGILEDDHKNLWISTTAGIVKCLNLVNNPDKLAIKVFTGQDGVQSNQFLYYSYYKSGSGEMFFGGIKGFSMFHPDSLKDNHFQPQIALTDIKVFNQSVPIGTKILGKTILEKSPIITKEISLSYKHRIFTLEFTALHNINPENVKYQYKLYPFEKEWNQTDALNPSATYTNLPGGSYTFRVKAANSDGVWSEVPYELKITILPPFWRTIWFFLLLSVLVIVIFGVIYNSRVNAIEKQKNRLELMVQERTRTITGMNSLLKNQTKKLRKSNDLLEEQKNQITEQADELEAQKEELLNQKNMLQNLNSMKDRFFSIIAHDLKGPFQGILGLTDILANDYNEYTDAERKKYFEAINNSSKNFYNLLDNLLNWARTQLEHVSVDHGVFDITELIGNNLRLLEENFTKKRISVKVKYSNNTLVFADRNMIDTVVRNLLSNAIKFSNLGGKVIITTENTNKEVTVNIKDFGIGMSNEQLQGLFLIDKTVSRPGTSGELGTGLGLILCHEFIIKNGGKIWVESVEEKGSVFHFSLPVNTV